MITPYLLPPTEFLPLRPALPRSAPKGPHVSLTLTPTRSVAALALAAVSAVTVGLAGAPTAGATEQDKAVVSDNRTIADIPVLSPIAAQAILLRDARVPIVVLGARLDEDCARPQVLDDRLDAATELARTHLLNPVIVSGGATQTDCPSEAAAMESGLRERGVTNQVLIEEESDSTVANVQNTKSMISDRGGLAVVVTSSPHNVRALQNFRDAGIEAVAYVGGEG